MVTPVRAFIVAFAFAVGIVVPMAWHDAHVVHVPAAIPETAAQHQADANALIADWMSYRSHPWHVVQTFTRTRNKDVVLQSTQTRTQDPPHRSVSSNDTSFDLVDGSQQVICSRITTKTSFSCTRSKAPDWNSAIATEIDSLKTYFFVQKLYLVTQTSTNCFRIDNIEPAYPSPPYGQLARFCFDSTTHALIGLEKIDGALTDNITTNTITAKVTDAEFALPQKVTFP